MELDVPGTRAARRTLLEQIRALPAATSVILISGGVGSRGLLRRFAKSAGITVSREYLGIPAAASPTCYVEDTPEAVRYFVSHVLALPRGGMAASAVLAGARAAARFSWPRNFLGAVVPTRIALGLTAPGDAEPGAATQSSDLIAMAGMHSVVLALSKDPNAKVTVLFIPSGSSEPELAMKVATTESAQASLAAERRVLVELRSALPGDVLATIPAVSELPHAPEHLALVTTALQGTPMTVRYHSWHHVASPAAVRQDFAMAERWLAKFQASVSGERNPIELHNHAADILFQRFGAEDRFPPVMDRLIAIQKRLGAQRSPRTPVHGDFWFGNLLLGGDEITGVVDWEAGMVAGDPVRDLARFALSYALYLDRHTRPGRAVAGHSGLTAGNWGAGIEYAIGGEGWFPDLFRSFLQNGLVRLGADPERWRDVALAGLADVAATADHIEFARSHWRLFDRLSA